LIYAVEGHATYGGLFEALYTAAWHQAAALQNNGSGRAHLFAAAQDRF